MYLAWGKEGNVSVVKLIRTGMLSVIQEEICNQLISLLIIFFKKLFYFYLFHVFVCTHVRVVLVHLLCMWRSENFLQDSVLLVRNSGCQGWFPMTFRAEPSEPIRHSLCITFNSSRHRVETITFLMLTQMKKLTFIH